MSELNNTPEVPSYEEIIEHNSHVDRHYDEKDAERLTGLDARCEAPSHPGCQFMRCQLGRMIAVRDGRVFHLIAYGETWNAAVKMFNHRNALKLVKK